MGRYKNVFYLGLGMIGVGILTMIFTKDVSHLWISGSGATIVALALMLDRLTHDWQMTFAELNGKFNGTTECVRACYADINLIKEEVNTLKPDNIDEIKMRVENLEAAGGMRQFGRVNGEDFVVKTYKPKPVPEKKAAEAKA